MKTKSAEIQKRILAAAALLLIGGIFMFGLSGCFGNKYKVDYCGQKDFYKGAKDSYRAGAQVELTFDMIATDTDYSFYLDGEYINPKYDEKKGFIISFVMPDHDVRLMCNSKNTMESTEDVMLVDYYSAPVAIVGDAEYYELVLNMTYDGSVRLDVYNGIKGGEEHRRSYSAPYEAVEKCNGIIEKYKLGEWVNMKDAVGITGAVRVCKYRKSDGTYVRASTDQMPQNGDEALYKIKAAMEEYIREENRTE